MGNNKKKTNKCCMMHDAIAHQPLTNSRLPFLYPDPPIFWVTPQFIYQALCSPVWNIPLASSDRLSQLFFFSSLWVFLVYLLTGRA